MYKNIAAGVVEIEYRSEAVKERNRFLKDGKYDVLEGGICAAGDIIVCGPDYESAAEYQYYEEKKSLMEKVKSCIQQSISGIKYSERTLENKFVHKLLKKALGIPESM